MTQRRFVNDTLFTYPLLFAFDAIVTLAAPSPWTRQLRSEFSRLALSLINPCG